MTETLAHPEAAAEEEPSGGLKAVLDEWSANPPAGLSQALQERGVSAEDLENYARSGITSEEVETLRRVLVNGAATGAREDAELLHRLTSVLDPRERAWDRLLKAKTTGEVLNATVTEATKGGLVVDFGVRGFVPSSQVGLSVPRNLTQYVGRSLPLRVLEVDRRRQTVVLSNRVVMEEERASKRKVALGRIQEGEVRQGTVRRLTDIGAFVDVGGVDGLLHVSEISWKRVGHPSEVLKVGQKVDVKVLRVDPEAGRVSLSIRRLTDDPWEAARRTYHPGDTTSVTISRIVPEGAVAQLGDDLEAFLPISELANRRVNSPDEVVQVGQQVEALILDILPRERRVVLSLRKLEQRRERQTIDTVQRKQQRVNTSSRTTLGDLFGHLFEEYQQRAEEPAENGAAPAGEAAAEAPAVEAAEPLAAAESAAGEPAAVNAEESTQSTQCSASAESTTSTESTGPAQAPTQTGLVEEPDPTTDPAESAAAATAEPTATATAPEADDAAEQDGAPQAAADGAAQPDEPAPAPARRTRRKQPVAEAREADPV